MVRYVCEHVYCVLHQKQNTQEASVAKIVFSEGVPIWMLTATNRLSHEERQKVHNSLSTGAYQVASSFSHLLLSSYQGSDVSKTQAELTQL